MMSESIVSQRIGNKNDCLRLIFWTAASIFCCLLVVLLVVGAIAAIWTRLSGDSSTSTFLNSNNNLEKLEGSTLKREFSYFTPKASEEIDKEETKHDKNFLTNDFRDHQTSGVNEKRPIMVTQNQPNLQPLSPKTDGNNADSINRFQVHSPQNGDQHSPKTTTFRPTNSKWNHQNFLRPTPAPSLPPNRPSNQPRAELSRIRAPFTTSTYRPTVAPRGNSQAEIYNHNSAYPNPKSRVNSQQPKLAVHSLSASVRRGHVNKLGITVHKLYPQPTTPKSYFPASSFENRKSDTTENEPAEPERNLSTNHQPALEDCPLPEPSEQPQKANQSYLNVSKNILEGLNFNANPCEDFHKFACGIWPLKNLRPPSQPSHTVYTRLRDKVRNDLVETLADNSRQNGYLKSELALKSYFASCLNEKKIDSESQSFLKQLPGGWPMVARHYDVTVSIEALIGQLSRDYGMHTVFLAETRPHELNSSRMILDLNGVRLKLGLGSMKHQVQVYLDDKKFGSITAAYRSFMREITNLAARDLHSANVSLKRIDEVYEFEKNLAKMANYSHYHDYNTKLWNVRELKEKLPMFDWDVYFVNALPVEILSTKYNDNFEILISTPHYFRSLIKLLRATDPRTIRNYFNWRLVRASIFMLSKPYRLTESKFLETIHGISFQDRDLPNRTNICAELVQDVDGFGWISARFYVKKHLSEENRAKTEIVAKQVKRSYEKMILDAKWIDPETKTAALQKLSAVQLAVGYPDWILNDQKINTIFEDFPSNEKGIMSFWHWHLKIQQWTQRCRLLRQSTAPVSHVKNRQIFALNPTATTAWYSHSHNSITLPAGQLQWPFIDHRFPISINYGAIGSVIGHELTHAIDQKGRMFDRNGELNQWDTVSSRSQLHSIYRCISNQYNQFCDQSINQCVNGQRTASENLADIFGLKAAFSAFQSEMRSSNRARQPILPFLESMNADQIFFLSSAQFWCGSINQQTLKNQLYFDNHSPAKFRLNGMLKNLPEFSRTFNCKSSDFMSFQREKCVPK